MAARKSQNHNHKSADLFLDITILPIYRLCKIFVSKTPFKESFMKQKGHFIFDCFCAVFWGYVTYWVGSWHTFGHQWIFFWELGDGVLLIILACFIVGKLRRRTPVLNLEQKVAAEEKREFKEVPKISFEHQEKIHPQSVRADSDNFNDVVGGLSSLGYNSHEATDGANFTESSVPDGTTEEKLIASLQYLGQN